MHDLGSTLASTAAFVALLMVAVWLSSVWKRNASIVDVIWGPGFAGIALVAFATSDAPLARRALVTGLALVWGLRLGGYLLRRAWGKPEDFRYQAMRRYWGARFPLVSLLTVFALQGVLMWIVSLPLQVAQVAAEPAELGALDALGACLWLVGMFFESVGDSQLARFKADPANAGRVMDRGLWRYTRHPNYFGDCLVWWGFFAIALAVPGGIYTLVGPIAMTVLLRRVSGVTLLERSLVKRRPGYAEYVARTNPFIPGPPRAPKTR
jgi:steroid 5-alpha reductase family enzyme